MSEQDPRELKQVAVRLVEGKPLCANEVIRTNLDAYKLLARELKDYDREVFGILGMNASGNPTCFTFISMGGLTSSQVGMRDVAKAVMLSNAAQMVGFHNHPDGALEPSTADVQLTQHLVNLGSLIDTPLQDHIIFGGGNEGSYYSMNRRGELPLAEKPELPRRVEDIQWHTEVGKSLSAVVGSEPFLETNRTTDYVVSVVFETSEERLAAAQVLLHKGLPTEFRQFGEGSSSEGNFIKFYGGTTESYQAVAEALEKDAGLRCTIMAPIELDENGKMEVRVSAVGHAGGIALEETAAPARGRGAFTIEEINDELANRRSPFFLVGGTLKTPDGPENTVQIRSRLHPEDGSGPILPTRLLEVQNGMDAAIGAVNRYIREYPICLERNREIESGKFALSETFDRMDQRAFFGGGERYFPSYRVSIECPDGQEAAFVKDTLERLGRKYASDTAFNDRGVIEPLFTDVRLLGDERTVTAVSTDPGSYGALGRELEAASREYVLSGAYPIPFDGEFLVEARPAGREPIVTRSGPETRAEEPRLESFMEAVKREQAEKQGQHAPAPQRRSGVEHGPGMDMVV